MRNRTLTESIKLRLPPELRAWFEARAEDEQMPVTLVYRRALRAYVDQQEAKP